MIAEGWGLVEGMSALNKVLEIKPCGELVETTVERVPYVWVRGTKLLRP